MRSATILACLLAAPLALACASSGDAPAEAAADAPAFAGQPDGPELYAVGRSLGSRVPELLVLDLPKEDVDVIVEGSRDALLGVEPSVELPEPEQLQVFLQKRMGEMADREQAANAPFLEAAAGEEGAVKLPSGLVYRIVEPGEGAKPRTTDAVRVHFEGRLRDGTLFTSTLDEPEPRTYLVRSLLPCWAEAVVLVGPGGKVHAVCPPELAYGKQGNPPVVKPGAALVFDIQLVDVIVRE